MDSDPGRKALLTEGEDLFRRRQKNSATRSIDQFSEPLNSTPRGVHSRRMAEQILDAFSQSHGRAVYFVGRRLMPNAESLFSVACLAIIAVFISLCPTGPHLVTTHHSSSERIRVMHCLKRMGTTSLLAISTLAAWLGMSGC